MNSKKVLTIASILIGISIVGNGVLFFLDQSPFNLTNINHKESISVSNISTIDIDSNTGDVTIVPYDGTNIEVQMKGTVEKKSENNFQLLVNEEISELTISAREIRKVHLLSFHSGTYELVVKLPRKDYERLEVKAQVGNINIDEQTVNQSNLTTRVGDIRVKNLQGRVYATTEVGEINLQLENILHDIVATTEVGNVSVKTAEVPESLETDLNRSIGKQTVELPSDLGGGGPLVKLTTEVGNLSLGVDGW
ncbi:DUF4097 family beta strand repeat-containing protein [Jeotgalibacillus marinus]|uniref:DUF4097 family beta strand repeat-containing protein n=1 Tax=Jeotgalibacillus marinus TaxID=86667 RepID=A0ABV3Q7P6_9BACL